MNLNEQTNTEDKKVLTHEERLELIYKPFPTINIIKPTKSTASYGPYGIPTKLLVSD